MSKFILTLVFLLFTGTGWMMGGGSQAILIALVYTGAAALLVTEPTSGIHY